MAAVPSGSLPTLMEREVALYEARIIAEYLDERFPHPPLPPSDPLGRARTRLTAFRIGRDWLSVLELARQNNPDAGSARAQLRAALVESDAVFRIGKYFLSNEISLADCLVLPLLWRLHSVGIPLRELGAGIDTYAHKLVSDAALPEGLV